MNVRLIIKHLERDGVVASCPSIGLLKLQSNRDSIPNKAVELARKHKSILIQHFTANACLPHNNPENYVDERVRQRIRTTCRVCGKFVGYRPEDSADTGQLDQIDPATSAETPVRVQETVACNEHNPQASPQFQ